MTHAGIDRTRAAFFCTPDRLIFATNQSHFLPADFRKIRSHEVWISSFFPVQVYASLVCIQLQNHHPQQKQQHQHATMPTYHQHGNKNKTATAAAAATATTTTTTTTRTTTRTRRRTRTSAIDWIRWLPFQTCGWMRRHHCRPKSFHLVQTSAAFTGHGLGLTLSVWKCDLLVLAVVRKQFSELNLSRQLHVRKVLGWEMEFVFHWRITMCWEMR